ncbi:MAG: group III truncated hemoglobin [Cryomorphaceae bacterium]|nr:group III truncated hemoglobin [Cryomorphaceae bacterium]
MNDIQGIDDVKLLVDAFYGKVRKDKILKDIFENVIQDRWPDHLEKMYKFWQTVLLEEHTYYGSPFLPHAKLPVEKEHFNRWLELFSKTIDAHFSGPRAEKAKWQGEKMAEMFHFKISYYSENNSKPLF